MTNEQNEDIINLKRSISNAVVNLVYTKFIYSIKKKTIPVDAILIPEIKRINEFLDADNSRFVKIISTDLIDKFINNDIISKNIDVHKLSFDTININELKAYVNDHRLYELSHYISYRIRSLFSDAVANGSRVYQNRDIVLFDNNYDADELLSFILYQTLFHFINITDSINKEIITVEDNSNIMIDDKEICCINHQHALAPLYFTNEIIENKSIIHVLEFVTSSKFTIDENNTFITTSKTNKVHIMKIL